MTDQELKKLRRQDLLKLLLAQSKEVDSLKNKLRQAEEELRERQIKLSRPGSIAEAALQINEVFATAEAAAAQWLENIRYLSTHPDELCARMEAESQKAASDRIAEAERKCRRMEEETRRNCEEMVAHAEQQIQAQRSALQRRPLRPGEDRPEQKEVRAAAQEADGGRRA